MSRPGAPCRPPSRRGLFGALATFVPLSLALAVLAALILPACSDGRNASLSVRLVYGQEEAAPESGGVLGTGDAAARVAGTAAPQAAYPKNFDNRILIRVLAPHIDPPIEAWFERSAGKGTIAGIPPGDRITVEVDEYDNTAQPPSTNAPLLGRGWAHGLTLAPGEHKDVPITMHDKGTIVRVCGNPPSGGAGLAGDTGDGGLAIDAALGQPVAIKAGPDDSIYVSSAQFSRVRRIDRYGYIWHFAGNGETGPLTDGQPALDAPIGSVIDFDLNMEGKIYLVTWDQQIISVNQTNRLITVIYSDNSGIFNPAIVPNLALINDNIIFYTNGMESRVFLVQDGIRYDYVMDNSPYQTQEGADRLNYPTRSPAGITYSLHSESVIFCDKENNKIKRIPISVGRVYTEVGNNIYITYFDGIDPLQMTPLKPYLVEYDASTGRLFFAEVNSNNLKFIDYYGKVRRLAGNDLAGFSGDGGPATAAQLYNPGAVTVDSRGNVYIADTGNHAIRMVVGGALP